MEKEQRIKELPFWNSLTAQQKDILRRSALTRKYPKGSYIYSGDKDCLGLLYLTSGEIRTYLLSDEGREVTLFRLYPTEVCVLATSCVISQISFETHMTAQKDTEVLIIPAGMVSILKEQNIYVRCFLYELATQRFSDVMWSMQQILFQGLDRRLANFLIAEQARVGSDTIRMTHEQIALHISSATITTSLQRMERKRLPEESGKRIWFVWCFLISEAPERAFYVLAACWSNTGHMR